VPPNEGQGGTLQGGPILVIFGTNRALTPLCRLLRLALKPISDIIPRITMELYCLGRSLVQVAVYIQVKGVNGKC
jgi:hypothetical protein